MHVKCRIPQLSNNARFPFVDVISKINVGTTINRDVQERHKVDLKEIHNSDHTKLDMWTYVCSNSSLVPLQYWPSILISYTVQADSFCTL